MLQSFLVGRLRPCVVHSRSSGSHCYWCSYSTFCIPKDDLVTKEVRRRDGAHGRRYGNALVEGMVKYEQCIADGRCGMAHVVVGCTQGLVETTNVCQCSMKLSSKSYVELIQVVRQRNRR